jgi:hypothetical protein
MDYYPQKMQEGCKLVVLWWRLVKVTVILLAVYAVFKLIAGAVK